MQNKLNDKELRRLLQKELKDEDLGFMLTSLCGDSTGIDVWVYACTSAGYFKSQPKLFVRKSYGKPNYQKGFFIVTIERKPRIIGNMGEIEGETINQIFEFIELNQKVLLQHWYKPDKMSSSEVCNQVKKIKPQKA